MDDGSDSEGDWDWYSWGKGDNGRAENSKHNSGKEFPPWLKFRILLFAFPVSWTT